MLKRIDIPAPQFLQLLDRHLLLHYPDIWASRIHIVLFYGGALLAVLLIHAFFRPLSLDNLPDPDQQFLWATIPSLLAFGPFAYHISTFSVEKNFGFRALGFGFRQQISLGVSILLLAIIPFLYASVLTDRIADSVTNYQLVQDIKSLDIGDVYFPAYTYVFEDYVNKEGEYNYRMHKYRLYGQGHYNSAWHSSEKYQLNDLHSSMLSRSGFTAEDRIQQVSDYIEAFNKYSGRKITLSARAAFLFFQNREIGIKNIKPNKEEIDKNLEHLLQAKEGQLAFMDAKNIMALGLFLLTIWVVLLLFLKMQFRDFSIGILGGSALATLIYGSVDVLTSWWHIAPGNVLFPVFLGLFTFFLIQISRKKNNKFSVHWKTISLMWITCMIPLFPLITVTLDGFIRIKTAYWLLYLGFGILLLCWNVFLNKKFTSLLARPTEN
jgi:hypothetical protein